jgi:predicted RNA-binding Zn-ribbon protein involved in translation (DUF1610 family)
MLLRECPGCGGLNVLRSRKQSLWERLLSWLKVLPYRCGDCGTRFYALK